jgi:streptogramin lyase
MPRKFSLRLFGGGVAVWATAALIVALGLLLALGVGSAVAAPVGTITRFSAGLNPGATPRWLVLGPDGDLWFTDIGKTRAIGRITPGGAITEFSAGLSERGLSEWLVAGGGYVWFSDGEAIERVTPGGTIAKFTAGLNAGSRPESPVLGPEGNLWFTDNGSTRAVGRITPDGAITEFSAGLSPGSSLGAIALGPDRNLWFDDRGARAIGRVTPEGVITEFSAGLSPYSEPFGIASGPDGNLWFVDEGARAIGRITPGGAITEFKAGSAPVGCGDLCGVGPVIAGPDGNLWFTEGESSAIDRITPAGVITQFTAGLSIAGNPQDLVAGPDGNVWFVQAGYPGGIGRITPAGAITVFSEGPSQNDLPWSLTVGSDGNLWFTEAGAIWRITTSEGPTQLPPAGLSTPTTPAPSSTASVSLAGRRITTSRGRATLELRCTGTSTCAGKLTLTAKTNGKGHKRRPRHTTIATAGFSIAPGKITTVKLTLDAAGRALLSAHHGRLNASLRILKSLPVPAQTHSEKVYLVPPAIGSPRRRPS